MSQLRQHQPRVYRPYIPLAVRVQVAERQLRSTSPIGGQWIINGLGKSHARQKLKFILGCLFGNEQRHLDHDPALVNRRWNNRTKDYDPRANDPAHLVYRTKAAHDIKTRVRGIGAQHSDLGQRRKNKALARNRTKGAKPKRKIPSRPFPKGRKMRAPA